MAVFAAAAAFGGVAQGVEQLLADNPQTRNLPAALGGGSMVGTFLAAELGILGLIAAVHAVQAALRLRVEETGQRAEPVLATGVGRTRWVGDTSCSPCWGRRLPWAGRDGRRLVHGLRVGDVDGQLPRVLGGALIQLPAVCVLASIAVAPLGLAPRLTVLAWRDIDRVTENVKTTLEPGGWLVISDSPFPDTDDGLCTAPGRVMCGIQFFEAQIDDQLLPRAAYDALIARHGFAAIGSVQLTPMHAPAFGQASRGLAEP